MLPRHSALLLTPDLPRDGFEELERLHRPGRLLTDAPCLGERGPLQCEGTRPAIDPGPIDLVEERQIGPMFRGQFTDRTLGGYDLAIDPDGPSDVAVAASVCAESLVPARPAVVPRLRPRPFGPPEEGREATGDLKAFF